jgi:transposase-like protein
MNEQQVCEVRRRRSRTEVEQLVANYEASGLTRVAFCARHGLSLSTFSRHRKRRERQAASSPNPLLAVELSPPRASVAAAGGALAVVVRGGRRIEVSRGFDAGALRQLVRVLEGA